MLFLVIRINHRKIFMTVLVELKLVAPRNILLNLIIITEAVQSSVFKFKVSSLLVIICVTSMNLEFFITKLVVKLLAVGCGVLIFEIDDFLFQLDNNPKIEGQQEAYDPDGYYQSDLKIGIPDVFLLPNDVLRLRRFLKFNLLLINGLSLKVEQFILGDAHIHALVPTEFSIESDECSHDGEKIFFWILMYQSVNFLIYLLNGFPVSLGNLDSSLFEKWYKFTVIKDKTDVRN